MAKINHYHKIKQTQFYLTLRNKMFYRNIPTMASGDMLSVHMMFMTDKSSNLTLVKMFHFFKIVTIVRLQGALVGVSD